MKRTKKKTDKLKDIKKECTCNKIPDIATDCPKHDPIDINRFGDYSVGLTTLEIKTYLKKRAGVSSLGNLFKKFNKAAGPGNTMGVIYTECCNKEMVLMYRWDVKRFADVVLLGLPTYFD